MRGRKRSLLPFGMMPSATGPPSWIASWTERALVVATDLMVQCLEQEGVDEYLFGSPGEENIRFVRALESSSIEYVLTRYEQAASF